MSPLWAMGVMLVEIRRANKNDLEQLLQLYTQLHNSPLPAPNDRIQTIWDTILADEHHFILVGVVEGQIISSCVLIIVPNLTHDQRPYALIENVITDAAHRCNGYATELLNFAQDIACEKACYKMMLMTSSKEQETLRFYKSAGYSSGDKTAFIKWM